MTMTAQEYREWKTILADHPKRPDLNGIRSKIEVYEFMADSPDRYVAYVNHEKMSIETWMGDQLARIVSIGSPKRSNFGDKRRYFTAIGINGIRYHGFSIGSNMYCRLKAYKRQDNC